MNISRTSIDNKIDGVRRELLKTMTIREADNAIYPLAWWIYSARASLGFLRGIMEANTKTIAKRLANGGTVDDVVKSLRRIPSVKKNENQIM